MPLRVAAKAWFLVSLQTFGGPAGQISVMHTEIVDRRRWVGEQRFLHALSYCTLLPGPEAQQSAIYLGWLLDGTLGGLIAGILFVLPGFLAILGLSIVYAGWGDTAIVIAVLAGVAPAVIAIVAQAVVRLSARALYSRVLAALAVASFLALAVFAVPFPLVIVGAALIGYLVGRIRPALIERPAGPAADASVEPAVAPFIADDELHQSTGSWPAPAPSSERSSTSCSDRSLHSSGFRRRRVPSESAMRGATCLQSRSPTAPTRALRPRMPNGRESLRLSARSCG